MLHAPEPCDRISDAGDLDVLLVGPGGQRGLVMSDACGLGSFVNANLTFDDAAASAVPDSCGTDVSVALLALPTDQPPADSFEAPAPTSPPYPATLGGFVGAAPNGTWTLYVYDDDAGALSLGFIGAGWTLDLTTAPPPALPKKKCKKGRKLKKGKCVKKKRKKKG